MSIKNCFRSFAALAAVAIGAHVASAAVFVQPTVSGNAPNGVSWAAIATGTALPVQSSGTTAAQTGKPGAVAYWDTVTGQLQIDTKGWDLSLFNFTYTTGTVNTSGSTAGPLQYATGTSPTSATVSGATGLANQKTMPAGSWTTITVAPARVAGTVSLTGSPALTTSYDNGNGAANGTSPYSTQPSGNPCTPGWMNQPWAFPADLVNSGSVSSMTVANWKVFGVSGNPNAGVLGYSGYAYQGLFQYVIQGVVGNQVGAVIPVTAVPEPGTMILAGVGIASAAGLDYRRRQKKESKGGKA